MGSMVDQLTRAGALPARGAGPFLGPNGSPLSEPDFNELNRYWDRFRGATSFIGATGPYAWMNGPENIIDPRARNYLNNNWGVIRGARYFTDINWGDPRLVGLPDYYYEIYPQALAAEPLPEVGAPSAADSGPAPAVGPSFTPTAASPDYRPLFSSEPLPDSAVKPAPTPVKAGLFSGAIPSWALTLAGIALAMPIILGKTPGRARSRRRR